MNLKLHLWLKGLIGAIIGGCANAVTLIVVDPLNFNFNDGCGRLLNVTLVSGIVSAAMYLKQSPVPPTEDVPPKAPVALLLALLLPVSMIGCTTNPNGNVSIAGREITPEQVQRDIKLAARIGAREGCKQDKNVEPYLQAAVVALTVALDRGDYDAETLQTLLANISIKEVRSESAAQFISDALELYRNHAADVVSNKLDKVRYLRPAMTGLRDGIAEGLSQYNGSR